MMPAVKHLFFRTAFLESHPRIKTIAIHNTGLNNTITSLEMANIMLQDTLQRVKTQKWEIKFMVCSIWLHSNSVLVQCLLICFAIAMKVE